MKDQRTSDGHESLFAGIVENSPEFVATFSPDGDIVFMNVAGRRLVGLTPDADLSGLAISDFHPDWAWRRIEEVGRPAAGNLGSWMGRSALVDRSGREIPTSHVVIAQFDDDGSVRHFSMMARDASEARWAENRLHTEVAVGQVLEGAESLEGDMPDVLATFHRFLDSCLAEFWIPGDARLVRTAVVRAAEGGRLAEVDEETIPETTGKNALQEQVRARDTVILVSPEGSLGATDDSVLLPEFAVTGLGFPVRSVAGFVGVVTVYWEHTVHDPGLRASAVQISRDIGSFVRRVNAEASMRQAQVLAEDANRAKSEFLANMSHEIRTPMTAILGYSDILGASLSDPDDIQVLETIQRNGRHLLDIVNDILDLSKIEAGRMEFHEERVSPAELAKAAEELMSLRAAEEGLSLGVSFESALPDRIVSDPVRIRQILLNLLSNAVKFTESGSVTLRLSLQDEAVVFRVDDTGIGIDPSVLQELFTPFTQFDTSSTRAYQGTGLGLTISARLASALGGALHAESEPGKGSSFFFSVPIGTADYELLEPSELVEKEAPPDPEESGAPSSHRLDARILAVDDRLDLRILVRHVLEEAGAEVDVASDGESAIEAVLRSMREARVFDVVIMDMQMPGMDGPTATRTLRRMGFGGKVIALTAGAQAEDRERALEAGCDGFVTKPARGPTLVEEVWKQLTGVPQTERTSERAARQTGPAVLLIEDDRDVAQLMGTLLRGWGCDVRIAHSGAEALEQAEKGHVDVLFSDLNLPDLAGTELLPRLRNLDNCKETVSVSLSGHAGREAERLSREAGFERHLVKPARFEDLKSVLATAEARSES